MSRAMQAVTVATALGCGLSAGVFFAFSSFVMSGLKGIPHTQGIAAMQSINRTAVGPLFMTVLFGSALACAGLVVWAATHWDAPAARWLLAAAVLFLLGAIVVTGAGNVPLNDRLEALDPASAGAAAQWASYVSDWQLWNHLRTVASLAATGLLVVALMA